MGIFFDWEAQGQAIVDSARFGRLAEHFPLKTDGRTQGFSRDGASLIGFALTPGYETYEGLGWYGVIIQGA